MADTAGNLPYGGGGEDERIEAGEEEDYEELTNVAEEKRATSSSSSSAFLAELNLVMMVAFLALSGDELSRLEEESEKAAAGEDHHVRELVWKLQSRRRRGLDDFKSADRRSVSRSQPRILDSRHGRKM